MLFLMFLLAPGHSQKKELSPGRAECYPKNCLLKSVKSVSCVTQLSCVQLVKSVKNAALNLPVGAKLQNFWTVWSQMGSGPNVVQILKQGYTLPFQNRPKLSRVPTVVSSYANLHRNSYLLEALQQLIGKNAVERVHNQTSLGFFNRLFLVPKPNNKWRPILDLSKLNLFLKPEKFRMETPETIRTSLQQGEWVTSVDFRDAYFHIPIQEQSRKYLRFHVQGQTYQFKALPFGLSTAPLEFTVIAKEVKLMAGHRGIRIHQYLDDWLVRAKSRSTCLQHTNPSKNVSETRLASECRKIRTGAKTSLQLCRLPIRSQVRPGQTDTGPVAKPSGQNKITIASTDLSGLAVHVLDRPTDSHRKTSSLRPPTHETHTVASQEQLESAGISGKDYSSPQVTSPTLAMVATGREHPTRPTLTPHKTCSADFYRRIKRRVGRSLKRAHCKGVLVSARKQAAYKLSGTKSSLPSLKRVPRSLYRQDSSCSNRQYNSGSLHKQGGRHEVGHAVCITVENLDLVFPQTSNSKSPTHPRPSKCDSGQTIQAGSDHPDGVVPPSRNFSKNMQQVAPASNRPVCHEVQSQITSVCVSSSGHTGCSSGCSHSAVGGSGCLCLPTDRHLGQSGGEVIGLPVQEAHSNCSRVAQYALVLGLGDHVQSSSPKFTKSAQSADTALQPDPSQKSDKSKPPRATAIKKQGFSEAVAARIEAPQRRSTRSVYEAKWTIFTKWCISNQVDFRSPPIKSVADFLLYLFEVRKLQPSTIDGYRSAIADKLGNLTVNISKDDNLTHLLESFHRDRPKGRRGIPSWNLSLVLHQLTKAPFEPLREASLKHLTFKTVFLLALGSGKRRSEIHAWQHKNIRHQLDWS